MAAAGMRWIQVRAKDRSDLELGSSFEGWRDRLDPLAVALWINDRPDLALAVGASGVHLGQNDLAPSVARQVVGGEVWIGRSTHDEEQVRAAAADPEVDVVAVGPVYPTASKGDPDPVVGLDLVRRARTLTDKPLVAIGGIDEDNVRRVLEAGADTAAVLSAVCRGGSLEESCGRLLEAAGEV